MFLLHLYHLAREKKEVRSLRQLNIGNPFRHEQHRTSVQGWRWGGKRAGMYLSYGGWGGAAEGAEDSSNGTVPSDG